MFLGTTHSMVKFGTEIVFTGNHRSCDISFVKNSDNIYYCPHKIHIIIFLYVLLDNNIDLAGRKTGSKLKCN